MFRPPVFRSAYSACSSDRRQRRAQGVEHVRCVVQDHGDSLRRVGCRLFVGNELLHFLLQLRVRGQQHRQQRNDTEIKRDTSEVEPAAAGVQRRRKRRRGAVATSRPTGEPGRRIGRRRAAEHRAVPVADHSKGTSLCAQRRGAIPARQIPAPGPASRSSRRPLGERRGPD